MSRSSQPQNDRVIKEVWCYNLDNEMSAIMNAATRYPYIGMVCFLLIFSSLGYRVPRNLFLLEGQSV